jgi:hypothetical protein
MDFEPIKLRPESGAIKDAADAHAFMMHMNLALQNKPHWQLAKQALGQFTASENAELKAWRAFRDAVPTAIADAENVITQAVAWIRNAA